MKVKEYNSNQSVILCYQPLNINLFSSFLLFIHFFLTCYLSLCLSSHTLTHILKHIHTLSLSLCLSLSLFSLSHLHSPMTSSYSFKQFKRVYQEFRLNNCKRSKIFFVVHFGKNWYFSRQLG